MTLCLATATAALALAADAFVLSWTHSVERTRWIEHWRIERPAGAAAPLLVLDEAKIRGSGAGMEPPDGAVLKDGWWVYRAERRLPALHLATSGVRGGQWRLCASAGPEAGRCLDLDRVLAPASGVTLRGLAAGAACVPAAR